MSKQHNIDQLFSGKLKEAVVKPSDNAWAKLEAGLDTEKENKRGFLMKIAAAIIILLVAAISLKLVLTDASHDDRFATVSTEMRQAPFPQYQVVNKADWQDEITLARNYMANQKSSEKNNNLMQPTAANKYLQGTGSDYSTTNIAANTKMTKQALNTTHNNIAVTTDLQNIEKVAVTDTDLVPVDQVKINAKEIDLVIADVDLIAVNSTELPKVTIMYKGQTAENDKSKNKFSFKKVLNSAKKLANGELIADLREAKDDLIQTAFKSSDD